MPFIASIFSAGLVMVVFSSCGRREADSGKRPSLPAVSSSLTVITSKPASLRAVVGRSESAVNVVPPAKGRGADESDQPADRGMATREGLEKSASPKDGTSSVAAVNGSGRDMGSSQTKAWLTPLVAVGFSPTLNLSAQQTAEAVRLGQDFLAATEAAPVSVQSPAQATTPVDAPSVAADALPVNATWRSAQEESDALFRAMFGYSAFNAQQLMRAQQAYRDQLAAGR